MARIPNYSTDLVRVQPPEQEAVRTSNVTTVEANMVFGSYNANTPALNYMYSVLGDVFKQGAGLMLDMKELSLEKARYDRQESLRKAKEQYELIMRQREEAEKLTGQGYAPGSLFQVPDFMYDDFNMENMSL